MISKIPPRKAAVRSESVGTAVKKRAARATGYAGQSTFERGAKVAGSALRKVALSPRFEAMRDFKDIKRGLRSSNDAAVKVGVASTAARLALQLPDLSALTGWGAFGALGSALGHVMKDPLNFNRDDFKGVMRLAGGKINDPDPSNGRLI